MFKFNPNTPLKFYSKETVYIPGQGNSISWVEISSGDYSTFYCEWHGGFGDAVFTAANIGIKEWGTIRTFYNPDIYEKLRSVSVVVIKNADESAIVDGEIDKNNKNVYELFGGVDNVLEENRYLEFKVRRYEAI